MRRRGFTILETLVAATLGILALSILTGTLIPMMRTSRRCMGHLQLSQLAHLTSLHLSNDLQSARPDGIQIPAWAAPATGHFCLQPVQQVTDTGKVVLADHLILYRVEVATGSLTRRLCKPPDLALDSPTAYSPLQLADFAQSLPGQSRILLHGVLSEFDLHWISGQRKELVRLKYLLKSNDSQYSFEEVIALRNGNL